MRKLLISVGGVFGAVLVLLAVCLYSLNTRSSFRDFAAETTHAPITTQEIVASVSAENLIVPQTTEKADCISRKNAYLLMKIAMAEAEGEDTEGKALVMRVVLNRVKSREFPDTIKKVIYQERQFSPVSNGRFDRVEPDEDCRRAFDMIQNETWDKSRGALYFESKSKSTWHQDNLQFLFRHGNHYFYTDREEDSD